MANLSAKVAEWKKVSSGNENLWFGQELLRHLSDVSRLMKGSNVLMYFSAFLQKPGRQDTGIKLEDINGIMNALYKMDFEKNLAVILHTPGGDVVAAEQIISYIHSKFKKVIAIVPVMSMSAGSMVALSCDEIIISKTGQLGPTDPQMNVRQRTFSVKDIKEQFEQARNNILSNPQESHIWAPIIESYSPALYMQAIKTEAYTKTKIRKWLKSKGKKNSEIKSILKVFHENPVFHGERIDFDMMQSATLGLKTRLLEDDQDLQNAVLQAYHVATIYADVSPMTRMIVTNHGNAWLKNAPQTK